MYTSSSDQLAKLTIDKNYGSSYGPVRIYLNQVGQVKYKFVPSNMCRKMKAYRVYVARSSIW